MKIKFYNILLIITFIVGVSSISISQALRQGNIIIDPYYGFPNFEKSFITGIQVDYEEGYSTKGLGPWGLRMEYLVGDQFGLTLDGIHNSAGVEYRGTPNYINDENGNSIPNNEEYRYKIMLHRLRVQVGLNYHFDFSEPQLDGYFGVAAGTNNRSFRITTTEPNSDIENESFDDILGFFRLPVSMRLRFGGRYYFSENIGMNMEFGLGGPVLSAGLSVRL